MAETQYRKDQKTHIFNYSNQKTLKPDQKEEEEEEEQDIELSLGLSLNGHFGSNPTRPDMVRSSSLSGFGFFADVADEGVADVADLGRTRSVPTEEGRKRRREEQTARRKEAKRKREGKMMREKGRVGGPIRERHVASQGSGSSGVSGSEGQPVNQVENISAKARSPQSLPDQNGSKQTAPIGETKMEIPSTKSTINNTKEMTKNVTVDMPCVSTQGVGPSAKRIDGFLYRYKKGEEVRIVCVCHGSLLTPAEFVKHAGGDDVAHPLKHIVVNPSPLS